MPRSAPAPAPAAPRVPVAHEALRGDMRRRIVTLLQEHPEGLTSAEMRTLLGVDKSLADTCLGRLRYGLLQRVGRGRYVAVGAVRHDHPWRSDGCVSLWGICPGRPLRKRWNDCSNPTASLTPPRSRQLAWDVARGWASSRCPIRPRPRRRLLGS